MFDVRSRARVCVYLFSLSFATRTERNRWWRVIVCILLVEEKWNSICNDDANAAKARKKNHGNRFQLKWSHSVAANDIISMAKPEHTFQNDLVSIFISLHFFPFSFIRFAQIIVQLQRTCSYNGSFGDYRKSDCRLKRNFHYAYGLNCMTQMPDIGRFDDFNRMKSIWRNSVLVSVRYICRRDPPARYQFKLLIFYTQKMFTDPPNEGIAAVPISGCISNMLISIIHVHSESAKCRRYVNLDTDYTMHDHISWVITICVEGSHEWSAYHFSEKCDLFRITNHFVDNSCKFEFQSRTKAQKRIDSRENDTTSRSRSSIVRCQFDDSLKYEHTPNQFIRFVFIRIFIRCLLGFAGFYRSRSLIPRILKFSSWFTHRYFPPRSDNIQCST